MTTGLDALRRIDTAIAEARRHMALGTDAAAQDARALAEIDQRTLSVYRDLADLRIALLKGDGRNGGALGGVDREAERLIAAHERFAAEAAAARDEASAALDRLERERGEAERAVEAAFAAHDEAAAATRARLESDPDYQRRAAELDAVNAMAARAGQKLEIARADRAEKGKAYEADPLFQYLHKRRFGTRDYRAFPLYALLDAAVARLIRYRDHRLNYERLLEIPVRFEEHAARLAKAAAAAASDIEAQERAAMERDGVDARRDEAAARRAAVEALDSRIVEAEAVHKARAEAAAAAAEGRDGPLAEARALLAKTLAAASVPDLKTLAAETAGEADDRLVEALIRLKRERIEHEEYKRARADSFGRQARQLSELEELRRRFKSARYDSPYSEISGADIVAVLLSEFLRGGLSRDDVWRRLERAHRTRRRDWDTDMGGDVWRDRFGLPDNWGGGNGRDWGGDWGSSWPRGGGQIRIPRAPRPPSGGGRRGGGFRTGGGF